MDIKYNWNKETGICIASIILPNGDVLQGYATCHPDDMDMCNEQTGCILAGFKLLVKAQQYHKNHILKPKLEMLLHLKSLFERNPNYNKDSYENKMLCKQIFLLRKEIAEVKCRIETTKQERKEYIALKDSFYKKIREKRGQNKLNQEEEISE